MPHSPLKLCSHPGCAARVSHRERHCRVHAVAEARAREARRSPRVVDGETQSGGGRDGFWRALRAQVLARDPICKQCHEKPSKHADHVLPKREGGRDELSNLRGMCHSCHSSKTAREDGGFGNPKKRAINIGRKNQQSQTVDGTSRRPLGGSEILADDTYSSARPRLHTHPQVLRNDFSAARARCGVTNDG